jgi:hypothetical protein
VSTMVNPAATRASVAVAPYALVRVSGQPYPRPSAATERFRRHWRALVDCERTLAGLGGPLSQALHDSRTAHGDDFHRRVVLPLRRDVHNGRSPSAAVRAGVGDLPARVPLLAGWLHTVDERERWRRDCALHVDAALAAERAVLAEACRAEPLRRAVALSSGALLSGLERAARLGPDVDARARKAEPKILRYMLRVTTKTSPWSWFTAVGWGAWDPDDDAPELDLADLDPSLARAVSTPNHSVVARLVDSVLADPAVQGRLRYRLAPALAFDDNGVTFRRDTYVGVRQIVVTREEQVTLPRTAVLDLVVAELRTARLTLDELAAALSTRLPAGSEARAATYVRRLVQERLFLPLAPVDPQAPEPLPALTRWLTAEGQPALAARTTAVDDSCRGFADLPANERVPALKRLGEEWSAAFAHVGAEPPTAPSLREDVVLRRRVRLDAATGRDLRADLARLTPLFELFDTAVVLRRLVRRVLVDRYGPGGTCTVADLVTDATRLWATAAGMAPDGTVAAGSGPLPGELAELAALRREVTAAVHAAAAGPGADTRLPDHLPAEVAAALPDWLGHRPASYGCFVQPYRSPGGTGWCVNTVADGWGRYASRFVDALGPRFARSLARRVGALLGDRAAQYRPVYGFNANLHPLLVADEVGEDPAWASLLADELEVVHDPDADVVRLRVAATGQHLDVLYLGFLMSPWLPDRSAPLYLDLGGSHVTLAHLAPSTLVDAPVRRRGRLSYRDIVLGRRTWTLDPAALVADLRRDGELPVAAAARWAARLGLPDAVFVSGAGVVSFGDAEAMAAYLEEPRPQFVDLANPLHLRCLPRLLADHPRQVAIVEALPVPGTAPTGRHAVELLVETYRAGR